MTVSLKAAVFQSHQAASIGANPQRRIPGGVDDVDAVVGKSSIIGAVVDHKSGAIEANESAGRAHPKITVRRLGDRLYQIFRKAVLTPPHAGHKLAAVREGIVLNLTGLRHRDGYG